MEWRCGAELAHVAGAVQIDGSYGDNGVVCADGSTLYRNNLTVGVADNCDSSACQFNTSSAGVELAPDTAYAISN